MSPDGGLLITLTSYAKEKFTLFVTRLLVDKVKKNLKVNLQHSDELPVDNRASAICCVFVC